MKSTNGWENNGNGNYYSFSGLPGGMRSDFGTFDDLGKKGIWWSSSELRWGAVIRELNYNNNEVQSIFTEKGSGFSVRCIENKNYSESLHSSSLQPPRSLISEKQYSLPIVRIGYQIWCTENLNINTYRNGDEIPQVQNAADWSKLTSGAWCYYEDQTKTGLAFGKLYNWFAVNDPRGLAPNGYHIPSDDEWTTLTDFLGGENIAAEKIKSTSGWAENRNGTNTSGFQAYPFGGRGYTGTFGFVGEVANFWSSTEYNANNSYCRFLSNTNSMFKPSAHYKRNGFSVRCLKD
jgi:uncharacterized protein (TIGR02145 family)